MVSSCALRDLKLRKICDEMVGNRYYASEDSEEFFADVKFLQPQGRGYVVGFKDKDGDFLSCSLTKFKHMYPFT